MFQRRGYDVRFCWVSVRVGISGNGDTDRLIREAAAKGGPPPPHPSVVPSREVCSSIHVAILTGLPRKYEALDAITKMGEITRTAVGWLTVPR